MPAEEPAPRSVSSDEDSTARAWDVKDTPPLAFGFEGIESILEKIGRSPSLPFFYSAVSSNNNVAHHNEGTRSSPPIRSRTHASAMQAQVL